MAGFPEHYDEFDRARFKFVLERLPKSGTFLDVGCGDGALTELMCSEDRKVLGLDLEPNPWIAANATSIPFPDNEFDYVTAFEILEHLYDDDLPKAIAEIKRVAKKKIFVSVPVGRSIFHHSHLRFFTEAMLADIFPGADVEVMPVGGTRTLWFWMEWSCQN